MVDKPTVLLIVTLDTKEREARFIRKCLENEGVDVRVLDPSIRHRIEGVADISPDQIAAAAGTTMPAVRALNDEHECSAIMAEGAIKCARQLHEEVGLSGIIGVGGSLGTAAATAVMRAFPFGLPKVMISTVPLAMAGPFVGTKDIVMINSVCDIAGLNTVTRRVFENGAKAIAGMARGHEPYAASSKPLVAMSTLSTIDKCSVRIRKSLQERGFEVMVFHTLGIGGAAMDEIVREQDVSVVLDLSLREISDLVNRGISDAGPNRCKAALGKGVPTIFVPGNIDFVGAGPIGDATLRFPGRRYHVHNSVLTAVRADADDFKRVAEHMAGLIKDAKGPVAFFVPLLGFSAYDGEQGPLHDPSLPPVFVEHLKRLLPKLVPLVVVPNHINDEQFADKLIEQVIAFRKQAPAAST